MVRRVAAIRKAMSSCVKIADNDLAGVGGKPTFWKAKITMKCPASSRGAVDTLDGTRNVARKYGFVWDSVLWGGANPSILRGYYSVQVLGWRTGCYPQPWKQNDAGGVLAAIVWGTPSTRTEKNTTFTYSAFGCGF